MDNFFRKSLPRAVMKEGKSYKDPSCFFIPGCKRVYFCCISARNWITFAAGLKWPFEQLQFLALGVGITLKLEVDLGKNIITCESLLIDVNTPLITFQSFPHKPHISFTVDFLDLLTCSVPVMFCPHKHTALQLYFWCRYTLIKEQHVRIPLRKVLCGFHKSPQS